MTRRSSETSWYASEISFSNSMIKNNSFRLKNKNWEIGALVNIGFVRNLKVIKIEAIKDYLPDIYTLEAPTGKRYEFIPHNGLRAI